MSVAKGADYPIERTKKSGIPFSQVVTVADALTTGTVVATIRPTSDDYVLYIDRIFVDIETASTVWELEINSPYLNFYDAPANDTGVTLAGLINDPAKVTGSNAYQGNIYLDGLMASYYYKKASNPKVASTGLNGAWSVVVGANATNDGTTQKCVLTFVGVQVKKKKGTTDTTLGQV